MEPGEICLNTIKLPLTELYYAKCGVGPPLIIVPATISRIRDWQPMIRFLSQKYTAHFFELPGHGGSTPFLGPFSSQLVGQTVEDLMDALHYDSVTLMGFSFGGILTLRVLNQVHSRINKVVLLAPCVSHRTLLYSPVSLWFLRVVSTLMYKPASRAFFLSLMHNPRTVDFVLFLLDKWGHINFNGPALRTTFLSLPASTLEVLTYQINEILKTDPIAEVKVNRIPCAFGMSRMDPLLCFETTKRLVQEKFQDVWVEGFDLPYHQPPEPFTFEQLNRDFGGFLEKLTADI